MESLVSTEWLADRLGEDGLTVIDCSWHMAASGRSGREEYAQAHITGARFLDIDAVADTAHPAPHMLPASKDFARAMESLGIGSGDRIVVYDNSPLRTSARGWFTFRHFGVRDVAILDGGLQKWIAEGRPVDSDAPEERETTFSAPTRDDVVIKKQILGGIDLLLLDARGKARFEGTEPEPRAGMASGHIPGARNLPYSALYREDGTFRSREELRQLFEDAGIDPSKPFAASCGSGVTASALLFAAHLLGNDETKLYDGSWSEWGADPATPKAVGPA
jgi:thiosulfate/3-mercaptopyruvate sulfurtransferase